MKSTIKLFGIIALAAVIGFGMVSCGDEGDDGKKTEEKPIDLTLVFYGEGNPYDDPLDSLSTAERWWSYTNNDSTATITHEVDSDGVCKITVGGTAMPPTNNDEGKNFGWWNSIWKAQAGYDYTAIAGKTYTYTFEAWTDGDERAMNVNWAEDFSGESDTNYTPPSYTDPKFKINSTRQTYKITGKRPILEGGENRMAFQGANQIGTFYVKIISIEEAEQKKNNHHWD